jgi:hypothetical protein
MSDIDGLVQAFEYLENYTNAIIVGTHKFLGFLPIAIEQHMRTLAQKKLNTTAENFMDAIQVSTENNLLVVTLDSDNWLANAVETGADPYDMKEKHLKSPKAKMSKLGFKYMVIPIKVSKNAKGSDTQKGQDYQQLISQALSKPSFKPPKNRLGIDGSLSTMEEVVSADPKTKGIYRIRTYESAASREGGGKPVNSQFIMFRVMSEKHPEKWQHPGLRPAGIFKDTEMWVNSSIGTMLQAFINNELQKI